MFIAIIPGERGPVHDRNVNHWSVTWSDSEEFRRCDARDGEWDVVDVDGLANGRRISGEPAAPVVVTKDRHLRCAREIVAIGNQAAGGWNNAEAAEEIARDEFAASELGLPANR